MDERKKERECEWGGGGMEVSYLSIHLSIYLFCLEGGKKEGEKRDGKGRGDTNTMYHNGCWRRREIGCGRGVVLQDDMGWDGLDRGEKRKEKRAVLAWT
jgi:hypothetical protein